MNATGIRIENSMQFLSLDNNAAAALAHGGSWLGPQTEKGLHTTYDALVSRVFIFADEAGNLDFSRKNGASRYFILTTVTMNDCGAASELVNLRRELAMQGVSLESTFHATEDKQIVRDEVFRFIADLDIRVDATVLEKSKAQPHFAANHDYFYKFAWFSHLKHIAPSVVGASDELLVVAASMGTKAKQRTFRLGISDVVNQCSPGSMWEVAFWPAASDPCLQIADYCSWAMQRQWERSDDRSFKLIQHHVKTSYDYFRFGSQHYY